MFKHLNQLIKKVILCYVASSNFLGQVHDVFSTPIAARPPNLKAIPSNSDSNLVTSFSFAFAKAFKLGGRAAGLISIVS